MKRILASISIVVLLSISSFGQGTTSNITIGMLSSYQGRILDNNGQPLCGLHDLTFKVFDDSDGLNKVWEENQSVDFNCDGIHDGSFNVALHIPLDSMAPWQMSLGGKMAAAVELERWLEVTIGSGPGAQTISPRTRLLTSPYSYGSARMIGDIYTSPSHIALLPNPGLVSDCAYVPVPLDMNVTSIASQIALRSPVPPYSDCAYVPLNLAVTDQVASIRLGAPQYPNDCAAYDPIQLIASSAFSKINLRPPVSDCTYAPLRLSADPVTSSIEMQPPDPAMGGSIALSTGAALSGPTITLTETVTSVRRTSGSMIFHFDQVNPGPSGDQKDDMVSLTATPGSGSSMVMLNPQPLPPDRAETWIELSTDATTGASLVMFNKNPGLGQVPAVQINGGTAAEPASLMMKTEAAGGGTLDNILLWAGSGDGRIGINTGSPSEALHVVGNICATGTIGVCSDERYKKNIETITDALTIIEKIRGVNFNWRTTEFPEKRFSDKEQVGFIAQELKEILPELVSQGSDGYYSVDYSRLTPVLVEAVKEQQRTIETMNQRLERLEKLVQELALAGESKKVEVASR